jgi:hypothetical protein
VTTDRVADALHLLMTSMSGRGTRMPGVDSKARKVTGISAICFAPDHADQPGETANLTTLTTSLRPFSAEIAEPTDAVRALCPIGAAEGHSWERIVGLVGVTAEQANVLARARSHRQ